MEIAIVASNVKAMSDIDQSVLQLAFLSYLSQAASGHSCKQCLAYRMGDAVMLSPD